MNELERFLLRMRVDDGVITCSGERAVIVAGGGIHSVFETPWNIYLRGVISSDLTLKNLEKIKYIRSVYAGMYVSIIPKKNGCLVWVFNDYKKIYDVRLKFCVKLI